MIKRERQDQIIEILKSRKYCTADYLSKQLFVAPITIRRDLTEMEAMGLVTRCYGGATIPNYENREVPFEVRNKTHSTIKEMLARKAAQKINQGDVVFLDASSTVSYITDYLTPQQNLTVITNSTLVAERLKDKQICCYLTGGMPVKNAHTLIGSIAEQTIAGLYANVCFFSAQGINAEGIISDQSEAETALRKLMIRNSQKQYFLFDGSKFQKQFAFRICSVRDISSVITDLDDIDFHDGDHQR